MVRAAAKAADLERLRSQLASLDTQYAHHRKRTAPLKNNFLDHGAGRGGFGDEAEITEVRRCRVRVGGG